ncbi:DNA-3-methyladenine glycosylase II [hydrothermal vent metagenome]|uniref:DNA-3-methyladenine glycosylase II n=1 Tax=hydrothermal vent metagenome TaxID=652676 RepID=A0A3B1E0Q6_9ZZZZ
MEPLSRQFFAVDAESLAQKLLGCRLVRVLPSGERLVGIIVETEAYLGVEDRASHTFGGRRTARNESMWGPAGRAYVYFTYGMHYCMNISAGREGLPVAVLLRALEPVEGLETMRELRAAKRARKRPLTDHELCAGPARLCQAMGIDRVLDGLDLASPGLADRPGAGVLFVERRKKRSIPDEQIAAGPRIGLSGDNEWTRRALRFGVAGSPYGSRPRL